MKDFTGITPNATIQGTIKGAVDRTESTAGTVIPSLVVNSWMTELAEVILAGGGALNPVPDDGKSLLRGIQEIIDDKIALIPSQFSIQTYLTTK